MLKQLTTLFLFIVISFSTAEGQCTTYAGSSDISGARWLCFFEINPTIPSTLQFGLFGYGYDDDPILDANDTLLYYLTEDTNFLNAQIYGVTGQEIEMTLLPGVEFDVIYHVYAVAGNNDGNGGIDFMDPCLSISDFGKLELQVVSNDLLTVDVQDTMTCQNNLTLDASPLIVNGNIGDYNFEWSNGATGPSIVVTEPGSYSVFISEFGISQHCPSTSYWEIIAYDPPTIEIFSTGDSISCEETELILTAELGISNYTSLQWQSSGPGLYVEDTLAVTIEQPGYYYLFVNYMENGLDCWHSDTIIIEASIDGCAEILGQVQRDENEDCLPDESEPTLKNRIIEFAGTQTRYAITDEQGNYSVYFPANEAVDVSIVSQHTYYEDCEESWMVQAPDVGEELEFSMAQSATIDCSLLEVNLHAGIVRRCFPVPFYLDYCNTGTVSAEDAFITITLDEDFEVVSSEIPFVDLGDGIYQFDLGTVAYDACGSFEMLTQLSCDAILGETICTTAEIFPHEPCNAPNPLWSGASVEVFADCDGLDNKFTIANNGTEDMLVSSHYIVIEDGVMLYPLPQDFQLDIGEELDLDFPANGKTYRLEALQVVGHPGASMPAMTLEGCGGFGSQGYVNEFPQDDLNPFIDIECREVIGSYDPNDKQAFPSGYGAEHFIPVDQQLEYHIRFQNTGTDTAFTVRIEDVLDANLNINTFRPLGASHDYEIEFQGTDTVNFIFNNILLPDSTVNETASHGFVRFAISPRSTAPLGTKIYNKAGIYFDFNEAVITNEIFHTLGEDLININSTNNPETIQLSINTYPNPTASEWNILIPNQSPTIEHQMILKDASGRQLFTRAIIGGQAQWNVEELGNGVYFWSLLEHGKLVGEGRMIRLGN